MTVAQIIFLIFAVILDEAVSGQKHTDIDNNNNNKEATIKCYRVFFEKNMQRPFSVTYLKIGLWRPPVERQNNVSSRYFLNFFFFFFQLQLNRQYTERR